MRQEASKFPQSDPSHTLTPHHSFSAEGNRASFWSDESSYSISSSPSASSIIVGSLTNSYICRLDEWTGGEDLFEDVDLNTPPSPQAAGGAYTGAGLPPTTPFQAHPHPQPFRSSSLSLYPSLAPSSAVPSNFGSPKEENGTLISEANPSGRSSHLPISRPSSPTPCLPTTLLSQWVHRPSVHRRGASLDSALASQRSISSVTHSPLLAFSPCAAADRPAPGASSTASHQSLSTRSSITSSAALCRRLAMTSSIHSTRQPHPFTYCPSSSLSVWSSATSRISQASTFTVTPSCSSVSEKELRRRRFLKLTRTLGEDIPPELVIGSVGSQESLPRRALDNPFSTTPSVVPTQTDRSSGLKQTHKKATSSILFPTHDSSNSLLNVFLSPASSRSTTGHGHTIANEAVMKRHHAGWGGGVGYGIGSLAKHCREKHRLSGHGWKGHQVRSNDSEKRHSIVKPATLLHRRPVLVAADGSSSSGAVRGLSIGKGGRKARGALLDVTVESTSCEDVVAYFEDHPFRVGAEEVSAVRDSASPTITSVPSPPASVAPSESPAPSAPIIQATPLVHRAVANLRPPSHLSPPSSSPSSSNRVGDSTRIHREEIPWMRHSMSLSPSLPSLTALTASLKHVEEAAPFSDYSPPLPRPTPGYLFPTPSSAEATGHSQAIYSTSKKSHKRHKPKAKKVRIDLPVDPCSMNASMLDLSVDRPSTPLDVDIDCETSVKPTPLDGLDPSPAIASPISEPGEHSPAAGATAPPSVNGHLLSGKLEEPVTEPEAINGAEGADAPEAGMTIVVDRSPSPIPRSESAMSGIYRSEKRQGWSGEWNQPHILDVIEKLRNL